MSQGVSWSAEIQAHENPLSEQERAVIRLIVEGRRPEDVAATLGISEQYLAACVKGVYAKLGVGDPFELVILALKCGLVVAPGVERALGQTLPPRKTLQS